MTAPLGGDFPTELYATTVMEYKPLVGTAILHLVVVVVQLRDVEPFDAVAV